MNAQWCRGVGVGGGCGRKWEARSGGTITDFIDIMYTHHKNDYKTWQRYEPVNVSLTVKRKVTRQCP